MFKTISLSVVLIVGFCVSFIANATVANENTVLTIADKVHKNAVKYSISANPVVIVIDFTLPDTSKRMYFIDTRSNSIEFATYTAHGIGSGSGHKTERFSNYDGTHSTSIGVFEAIQPWKHPAGHKAYRVVGLEPWNNNAYNRFIELHGATYVGPVGHKQGHSWGCFAVPFADLNAVMSRTQIRTLIVAYYPDKYWLEHSKFLK